MRESELDYIPNKLGIVATLFLVTGVYAFLDIIISPLFGKVSINLGVFAWFVGIGLFRARPSSRTWAKIWVVLGIVGLFVLGGFMLVNADDATFTWDKKSKDLEDAILPTVIVAVFALLLLNWMRRVLWDPRLDEYFYGPLH